MAPDAIGEAHSVIPEQLGKYRLLGQLGRGGMADVFLAVASGPAGFNKLHVLKLLRQESFDNFESARMFAHEARLAALLNHPNVVQTYEVGEDKGVVFLVMEYLDGQSLHTVLKRIQRLNITTGLSMGMRLRIVVEVLNGLHHAHELRDLAGRSLNLVHRDVSPQNIFVTYDGSIKLVDFGVAKSTSTTSSTRVGTIKGKAGYMAPEQVNNPSQISRRTDVFQVGLLLWEGIVGRRMWEGLTDYEVLLKLANNDLPEFELPPDADPELVRIGRKAIAVAAEARYATAEEFASDLEALMVVREMRITAKDVGAFVARLFADERQELRDAVQRRLTKIQDEPIRECLTVDDALPPIFGSFLGAQTDSNQLNAPGSIVRSTSTGSSSDMARAIARSAVAPARLRQAGRIPMVFATIGVGLVAILAVLATRTARDPAPVAEVSGRASSVDEPVDTVEVSIGATPSQARLLLDNAALPTNPFRGRVRKDSVTHIVRAEAAGYESATLVVHFERDTDNAIALTPVRATPEAAPAALAPARAEIRGSVSRVTGYTRTKSLVPVAPATRSSPTPSAAAAPPPVVKLDSSDPWR